MSTIKYRPEVDGLRALAVIPVILFHLGYSWIHGGFVGVDVFFVISGYLISLIILREQQQGNFTFAAFWARRARRILPALSSVILASILAGVFILFRTDWKGLGEQGLSVFGLIANFKMLELASNYWAPTSHETPLLHTWSLAVEEQFYLFYPLLLITILKFARNHAFTIIFAVAVASFGLGWFATRQTSADAFYLLPYRAWELAAGCLLALWQHTQPLGEFRLGSRSAKILSLVGAITIISSFLIITERKFPGDKALYPVIGAVLVMAFASAQNFVGRLLAWTPICYLGKISYSLYLWHWPVIVYAFILNQQRNFELPRYGVVGIILILSAASYHFIERPARHSKTWAIPVSILTLTSLAASAAICFWPIHYDLSAFSPVIWNGQLYDTSPMRDEKPLELGDRMFGIITPIRQKSEYPAIAWNGVTKTYGDSDSEVMVLGDSHSLMWSSTIDSICHESGITVSFFGANGTRPSISSPPQKVPSQLLTADEKFHFDSARLRTLNSKKLKLVILSARYSEYKNGKELEKLLDLITRSGVKCLIIEQPPMMPFGDRNALIYCADNKLMKMSSGNNPFCLPIGEPEKWRRGQSIIESEAKTNPSVDIIEIADIYQNDPQHAVLIEGTRILYIDDDHLSEYGAMKAKVRIYERIRKILAIDT